jgi:hypothetical protein
MKVFTFIAWILPVTVLLCAASVTVEDAESGSSGAAADLPFLAAGQHAGMIVGFNPSNPPATAASIEARWQEAMSAGMRVGRLQIDWDELEPRPSEYDTDALAARLEEYSRLDLQSFLLISVYDSEGPVVPDDLKGRPVNDPELIRRFERLLDWVVPMLVAHDGYMISVVNEAGNAFGEVPGLHEEVLTFLRRVKTHIHGIDERVAVTATIAEGNIGVGKPGVRALIDESDVACFNFYGAKLVADYPYYEPQSDAEIRSDIRRMLDVSGSKQIVIQELGMWSGSDRLTSNEEIQRRFFEVFFDEMQKHDRLRVAYLFQLVDWSPRVSNLMAESLRSEEVPAGFVEVFIESLETIGLIRYEDGTRKAAWYEYLGWIERLSGS